MNLCGNDATTLRAVAEWIRESASIHQTLCLATADIGLRQRAANNAVLRHGLYAELMLRAQAEACPDALASEPAPSREYLGILKCLVRGEVALAERRLARFDADIVGSIQSSVAHHGLSNETIGVLRLIAPVLTHATAQTEEASPRRARR